LETNYKIVNLINGLNIVGDVEYTPEEIIIKFPLEVTAKPIMNDDGNLVGEHMVLRPYLVMTDDREVLIDQFSVISSCSLSERLYKSYEEMVSNVYDKTISLDGNFYKKDGVADELPEEIQEMSKEELEYLEEQLDLIASVKDKTLH
tara:strand:+ start:327 stop:767 length:441 start_codon:yes stop_codon:yes gene_type:complete